jgi:hypothetical protein
MAVRGQDRPRVGQAPGHGRVQPVRWLRRGGPENQGDQGDGPGLHRGGGQDHPPCGPTGPHFSPSEPRVSSGPPVGDGSRGCARTPEPELASLRIYALGTYRPGRVPRVPFGSCERLGDDGLVEMVDQLCWRWSPLRRGGRLMRPIAAVRSKEISRNLAESIRLHRRDNLHNNL